MQLTRGNRTVCGSNSPPSRVSGIRHGGAAAPDTLLPSSLPGYARKDMFHE